MAQVTGVVAGSQVWQLKMTNSQARQFFVMESRKLLLLELHVQAPEMTPRLLIQPVHVNRSLQAVQREGQAVQEVVGYAVVGKYPELQEEH